jgi:predicted nucleic acid-binding protein
VLCVSTEILEEYEEILQRLTDIDTAQLVIELIINNPYTLFLTPYYKFNLIAEDPDDNKFVDCAIAANAKYIVSEDRHFDVLKACSFPQVNVIGLDLFANLLESKPYMLSDDDASTLVNEPLVPYGR